MGVLKIVEWSQSLQISLIGGAMVFGYIASTINLNEKFNNGIRLLFYLFTIAMVIVSIGMNFPILQYEDSALLDSSSIGGALNGVFISLLVLLALIFLLLLMSVVMGIVMTIKDKKMRRQYGEPD